jgi:protein-L-isoaspartate(D-aspartate) O-methyltransferase
MESTPERYLEESRERLLRSLERVVVNPRVIAAFRAVPRQLFVPPGLETHAWEDRALPLVEGQTISQPTMIAMMLDALSPDPNHRVLEVGSGCGYAAALLGFLSSEVHGVEIRPNLASMAVECLERAGVRNVTIHVGDGSRGLPEFAPYDSILVSAGANRIPEPLVAQIAPGGRIAIPVGDGGEQVLEIGHRPRSGGDVEWRSSIHCVFVPLVDETRASMPNRPFGS